MPEPALVLESFRVRAFRQVRDSGEIPVFPLTALVGRGDSGKTSLLFALRGLSPDLETPYSLARDWPRGARRPGGPEHVVCRATFRFTGTVPPSADLPSGTAGLHVGRTYGGELVAAPWDGSVPENGLARAEEALASEAAADLARANLPRLLFVEAREELPDHLPRDRAGIPSDSATAALLALLEEVGLPVESLWDDSSPARLREATERLNALLEERKVTTRLSLRADRGRAELHVERSGRLVRAERLDPVPRFRLAVELRLAVDPAAPPILLIDGPGRVFRREGGLRMRSLLESWAGRGAPVLYTARLPFDLELQHPEQVLVLEPSRTGSMARHLQAGANHADLRAALGMTGRASFRIAEQNLVVEGPTDVGILGALDELFARSGEPGLPEGVSLTAAGGSHEVTAVARFLGNEGLSVVALYDSDAAGRRGADELSAAVEADPRLGGVAVLGLSEAAGLGCPDATIEDLFPSEVYLEEVRRELSPDATLARHLEGLTGLDRQGGLTARVAKLVEREGQRFPKGKVAEALARRVASLPDTAALPRGTRGPARRLLRAVRRALDDVRPRPTEGTNQDNGDDA